MQHCDVLIVGGGPAGSSLAWGLRQSGLDVLLMDKKNFPRNKVCAGWITPAVIETLQIDIGDYGRERTIQPIHGFHVSRMGGREVEAGYGSEPISYGIRRSEFDDYLLQRCGARRLLGEPFKNMVRRDGAWYINEEIKAALVVGAGGHFCPVARHLGARPGRTETAVTAQEVEFRMTPQQAGQCSVRAEYPELFFCEDLKGYGWVFRKGEYLNIGLGRESTHRLAEHVQAFCHDLREQGKIPPDIPDRFNGHAYLLYQHAERPLLSDGALLIGDAAGLAYTQSGEGIRPAVESGLLAAKLIRESQGDYNLERLRSYQQAITQRFGKRPSHPGPLDRLPEWLKQFLAGRLLSAHWFIRGVVMDRWFLHVHQSPLLSD